MRGRLRRRGARLPHAQAGQGRTGSRRAKSAISSPASRTSATPGSATRSPARTSPTAAALPGFKEAKPMVFCGMFPAGDSRIEDLRDALEKLRLNDASFYLRAREFAGPGPGLPLRLPGPSPPGDHPGAAGARVRAHLVTTAPSVSYRVTTTTGEVAEVRNPSQLPAPQKIQTIEEPIIEAIILTPGQVPGTDPGPARGPARRRRRRWNTSAPSASCSNYILPLNEVVFDFYNQLKSLLPGLRLAWITSSPATVRRPSSSSTS